MNYNKRGEIATMVALAALVVIGLSSFIASNLLKQKFTFLPRAQQSTTWSLDSWDEAANRCPDKGSGLGPCICSQLPSEGICAPVGSINAKGLTCIKNKWDTTWGCWGSPSSANIPGAADSSSAPGSSCGLTRSQYGTCPDWATENSCHQRLDPPGDPDYGKWFKCVNKWWNGPCDSKEVCEGSVAAPPAEAPPTAGDTSTETQAGPVDTSGLSSCYNYTSQTNCEAKCQRNNTDDWYCNKTIDGKGTVSGKYCCFPELSDRISLTPTPAPGTLGGQCGYYINVGCNSGLKCVDTICVEDTSTVTIAPAPPIPITTPGLAVITGNEEGKCFVENAIIKVRTETFTENSLGEASCGSNVLLGQSGNYTVYRTCQDMSGNIKPCRYACFNKNKLTNCFEAVDERWTNTVRIMNNTIYNLTIDSLLITKHQGIPGYYPPPVVGKKLIPDETYTVDFSGTDAGCGTWFNYKTVDASLTYTTSKPDGTVVVANGFVKSDWQWCQWGVNIVIIIK